MLAAAAASVSLSSSTQFVSQYPEKHGDLHLMIDAAKFLAFSRKKIARNSAISFLDKIAKHTQELVVVVAFNLLDQSYFVCVNNSG